MESTPFYVGQRVVCIDDSPVDQYPIKIKKDEIYTVKGFDTCCNICYVNIGILNEYGRQMCAHCGEITFSDIWWVSAKRFAPIEENFQSISLTKVLEEESKLIGVN